MTDIAHVRHSQPTSGPPVRALFACVAENGPQWHTKVTNLLVSLRAMGGTLADAPFSAGFVEGVSAGARQQLESMGASVRVVDRVDPRNPYANKLRMLELARDQEFDVLVALDCDTLVGGDIHRYLRTDAVAAKRADQDPLQAGDWERLFRAVRLGPPIGVPT